MDALLRIDHTQQRSVRCREGVLLFMLRESRTPEKHAVFRPFPCKILQKQLETLLLQWYNKLVILWENRRMPSADRPRAWGFLWGV